MARLNKDLELIISLKKSKKDGTLDADEYFNCQEEKWRNTISYKRFESWLICSNEELRLNALELLAISKKSTMTFTEQELNLVIVSLKHNIRERIEHVPLIKKILKRVSDSYAVLKRQVDSEIKLRKLQKLHTGCEISNGLSIAQTSVKFYQTFLTSIHEACLKNIYSGAVNVRKKSSLQILCLMEEFLNEDLKKSLWNLDDLKVLFDCLLLDTYDLNKDMAYRLIKSSNLIEFYIDTKEKLVELVNVGCEMANSIRPLDAITAACMLKVSMLLPNIQDTLCELVGIDEDKNIEEKSTFYMIMLLKTCLEKPVKLAAQNIVIASSKHSFYGYVYCIHTIMSMTNLRTIANDDNWRTMLSEIVNMCFALDTAVSQIVNNSSPEGHLPMDLNPQHLDSITSEVPEIVITPQMVLLCSWRTVKEISLFFGYLTCNIPIYNEKTKSGLLTESQITEIGNVLVTLLCETKHRGAFEQTHVGFSQLCSRLWHLTDDQPFLKKLPKMWLQQLLLAVVGLKSDNPKLCATRRSAGVPFMVQALVTSEIKKKSDPNIYSLHSVMRILLQLTKINDNFNLDDAKKLLFNESLFADFEKLQSIDDLDKSSRLNEITEIKTHSLNILRALYRHCQLGDLIRDYVADGFIAAFKSYDGISWAERNAATLLFSALVTRVFGVQRTKDHVNLTLHNRMTGKNFFEKFPSLLPFLLNELNIFINEPEDQIKPKIQSILLILSRLYPGVTIETADEDWKVDQFIDLVSKCAKSKVYKTRELAARALVPLLSNNNIEEISMQLLNSIVNNKLSLNLLHGYMLQLLEITRSEQFSSIQLSRNLLINFFDFLRNKLLNNLKSSVSEPACYSACIAAVEICIELVKMNAYSWIFENVDIRFTYDFTYLLDDVFKSHLINYKDLKRRPAIELYEVTVLKLLIEAINNPSYSGALVIEEHLSYNFWSEVLKHRNVDVSTVAWSNCMNVIQKNMTRMDVSSLYEVGFTDYLGVIRRSIDEPDLQDASFDFLYSAVMQLNSNAAYVADTFPDEQKKIYICSDIFNELRDLYDESEKFYPRREFFKLFGASYGFLMKSQGCTTDDPDGEYFSKSIIFGAFLTHSKMESNFDCRLGISEVLSNLYTSTKNQIYTNFVLDWWTILLNLLYDDSLEIRSNAARIVCDLPPRTKLDCETIVVDTFFSKFTSIVGRINVQAACAAFFAWSMTTAAVVLEEMDETDVFNKSCNYECFEPLQITQHCVKYLKTLMAEHPNKAHIVLPMTIKFWLRTQLNLAIEFKKIPETLSDFIIKYKAMIPTTEKSLSRILDPTYPARQIKEIAYLEMRNAVI